MSRSRRHAHVGQEAYPYAATVTICSTWARDTRTGQAVPTDTRLQRAKLAMHVAAGQVGPEKQVAGHSWIVVKHATGRIETHGTWGTSAPRLGYRTAGYCVDREKRGGMVSDFSRSADVTPEQLKRLMAFCREMADLGLKAHGNLHPCSWFAAKAFEIATGERLVHRHLGVSNPTTLCRSVARSNGHQHAQTQDPGHRL